MALIFSQTTDLKHFNVFKRYFFFFPKSFKYFKENDNV